MKTTLTLASVAMKKSMDTKDTGEKVYLLNEAMALSLLSIAESLNRLGRQPSPKTNPDSD